jgi:hypothetical protein
MSDSRFKLIREELVSGEAQHALDSIESDLGLSRLRLSRSAANLLSAKREIVELRKHFAAEELKAIDRMLNE